MPGSGGAAGNNAPDGGTSAPAGPEIPLPLTVTTHFPNQGWFADPSLEPALQGGSLIMQADAVTGPCAKRIPDARGKCLKVVYTPPANLTPPAMGGWVGVFFLTTILREHPELTPPLKIGAANWGAEPGKNIAPGATKISFAAAAAEEGLPVTFKAGTMVDAFVMPEQDEILGAEWKTSALPFAGQAYGTNVVGAFAWVLKDTTKSATFYLDNIVWE